MAKKQSGKRHELDPYEQAILGFCRTLFYRLIRKYRKGRIEHGGSPIALDCQKEINLEVLDILNYHLIHNVNTAYDNKKSKVIPRKK